MAYALRPVVIGVIGSAFFAAAVQSAVIDALYLEVFNDSSPLVERFASSLSFREIEAYLTAFWQGYDDDQELSLILQASNRRWEHDVIFALTEKVIGICDAVGVDENEGVKINEHDKYLVCLLLSRFVLYRILYQCAAQRGMIPCYFNTTTPLPIPDVFDSKLVSMVQGQCEEDQISNTDAQFSTE